MELVTTLKENATIPLARIEDDHEANANDEEFSSIENIAHATKLLS